MDSLSRFRHRIFDNGDGAGARRVQTDARLRRKPTVRKHLGASDSAVDSPQEKPDYPPVPQTDTGGRDENSKALE